MSSFRLRRLGVTILSILALAVLPVAVRGGEADGGTGYDLRWNVVPAGGDIPALHGFYTLGAAGQPDVSLPT